MATYVFFGEVPTALTLGGAGIIFAIGVYSWHREMKAATAIAAAAMELLDGRGERGGVGLQPDCINDASLMTLSNPRPRAATSNVMPISLDDE